MFNFKNLENYGVQELNAKEIKEVDGGFSPVWEWFVDEIIAWVEDGGLEELGKKIAEGSGGMSTTQYGVVIGN